MVGRKIKMKKLRQKKIASKGYTLEIDSWENDGDYAKCESYVFETKEEAIEVLKMAKKIWVSSSNNTGGIGNLMNDKYKVAATIIIHYFIENPKLLEMNELTTINDLKDKVIEFFKDDEYESENVTEENWREWAIDYCDINRKSLPQLEEWVDLSNNYNYTMMGGSECYYSRVFQSGSIFYSPENIFLERIA